MGYQQSENVRKIGFVRKSGKKLVSMLTTGIICIMMLAGCGSSDAQKDNEELLSGKHHVEINIKDKGTISVELDADAAPITVTNFIKLAKEGFYDGLTFHRIINGFMMQG